MKKYLSFDGLSHVIDNLINRFSIIGHTHTKSEITDFESKELIVVDDDNGNVSIELPTVASIITSDNEILTVGR